MSETMATPHSSSSATDNILTVGSGELDPRQPYTELRMPDGRTVRVETALLAPSGNMAHISEPYPEIAGNDTIPIIEEQLVVGKRVVTTGIVKLQKTVQEYQQALDETLLARGYEVERVVINKPVDAAPEVRHEGNLTVYPVIEEQLILTKQLILKEEIHVTQRDTEHRDTQVVTLRRDHVAVVREPGESLSGEKEL